MKIARPSNLQKYWVALLILIFGIAASVLAYSIISSQENKIAENEFIADSKVSIEILERAVKGNINSLDAVKGFYESSDEVETKNFRKFAQTLLQNHPTLYSFAWLPRIDHTDRDTFEELLRLEGVESDFIRKGDGFAKFTKSEPRAEYYPLYIAEPGTGLKPRIGLDFATLPKGGPSIEQAIRTEGIIASAPITNPQEFSPNASIMIYASVKNPGLKNQISGPSDTGIRGMAAALFLVGDLVSEEFNTEKRLDIQITDITDPSRPQKVYGLPSESFHFKYDKIFSFAGRNWHISSTLQDTDRPLYWVPIAACIAGILLSLLASFTFASLIHRRQVVEDLVDLRTEELSKTVDQLADSNEELERFAFVCSHDLQEPLRMIRSFSEKLQVHIGDDLEGDEKGKKYFRFITDGAERAQDLITDILAYSSINSNTQALETFESQSLIDVIQANMAANLEASGGRITHDVMPELTGNKTQLMQLFQNLINNGLKYQAPGTAPHVHVGIEDNGLYWEFSVKDNGIGMQEKHLGKIFDVFQRLHRKNQYAGTGVGLSICKKVVERHGGAIWVESEIGVGSVFHFTILKSEA